jgi:SAM-dependent methyltransferase
VSSYVFDNAAAQSAQRFASLEACYDPVTIRQLEQIGVCAGWWCLEVGAGNGSIARWVAERVAPAGHVVVTDIDPRWLELAHPNVEVREHDIASDELEQGAFELAHERLVLIHLRERDRVLGRMIDSLKPGGWLLIEDLDCTWLPLGPYGNPDQAILFKTVVGAYNHALEHAGLDVAYGRRFHPLLRAHGLIDVHVEAHIGVAVGGSPGARLLAANIEQLRDRLTGPALLGGTQVERALELLEDPEFSFSYQPLVSGRGRRPPR